jgi:hypothetical protein
MSDHEITKPGLIDISEPVWRELIAAADESGLGRAVRRFLQPGDESARYGFSNII